MTRAQLARRAFLLSAAAGVAGAGALGAVTFRLHSSPRTTPFLTEDHLSGLTTNDIAKPRVLFIGNSLILHNDLTAMVAESGRYRTAMAAADGARLVETARLPAMQMALTQGGWDAIVLQDFTKTPPRAIDRFASARAMAWMADQARPAKVLLYPPWPAAADNKVYVNAGRLTATPASPRDFADRTMAHYTRIARDNGFHLVPVPEAWLAANDPSLYARDGHHPSATGSRLVALLIETALREVL